MNIRLLIACAFILGMLASCNNQTSREELVATVGGAPVYKSDVDFLMGTLPVEQRVGKARNEAIVRMLDTRIRAEAARHHLGDHDGEITKLMARLRSRNLSQTYEYFYLNENLGQSTDSLQAFFRANRALYADDSLAKGDFILLRSRVAKDRLLRTRQAEFDAYYEKGKERYGALANDSIRKRVESDFIDDYRRKLISESPARLRELYKVTLEPVVLPGLEEYYKAHAEEFKTAPAFRLFHIEMKDSAALASLLDSLNDQARFAALAKNHSVNAQTRERSGDVGLVKPGHSLPWGIGMMPDLFALLDGKQSGYTTPVLRAPDTESFHVFFLDSSVAPQIKPFDRARKMVADRLSSQGEVALDSAYVLARMGDQVIVREKDVLELREEIPPYQRAGYNRDRLLSFLVDWATLSRAAEDAGIDRSAEYQAWNRLQSDRIYAAKLRDSLLNTTLGVPDKVLRDLYTQNPDSLFSGRDYEAARLDLATWNTAPDVVFQREFVAEPKSYESWKDWQSAKTAIFRNIRQREYASAQRRALCRFEREFPVVVLDSTIEFSATNNKEALLKLAQEFYSKNQLPQALEAFTKLRDCFANDDHAQSSATMELAKLLNDMEQFDRSAKEYRTFAKLWPDSPDAYKALFMEGFILSENLKQDSAALPVFRELLRLYPKSDLADDADWMIRNIESGGALVPALLDSIANTPETPAPAATTP